MAMCSFGQTNHASQGGFFFNRFLIYYFSKPFLDKSDKIYIIGIPEYRKYCTALEAFFWLIVDGKTDIAIKILTDYSLSDLLDASWNYTSNFFDCDDRIMPVVESIKDNQLKLEYLNDLKQKNYERIQVGLFSDYFINRDIFTQNGQKQIESALRYVKKNERWGSPKIILDRLNAPVLLDYYINHQITYSFDIPGFHRSYSTVLQTKVGDCDDLAFLGKIALKRSGYDVFGRIVSNSTRNCHIGLGVRLPNGSFLLAVHFNRWGNHMCGPFNSIPELDKALGYGTKYALRNIFNFDWQK